MPADTCEGTFSRDLWQWITTHFCLKCAITFDKQATPFPQVDTNAVVFMIKNAKPEKTLTWVKVLQPSENELLAPCQASEFKQHAFNTLEVEKKRIG